VPEKDRGKGKEIRKCPLKGSKVWKRHLNETHQQWGNCIDKGSWEGGERARYDRDELVRERDKREDVSNPTERILVGEGVSRRRVVAGATR